MLDPSEHRVTNPATGAQKGKKDRRFDLIPTGPLSELARSYGLGAEKYEDRNWELGNDWSLHYAAAGRHMTDFWAGESVDPENGVHHLASAVFHLFALMEYEQTHPELDDSPGRLLRKVARTVRDAGKRAYGIPQRFVTGVVQGPFDHHVHASIGTHDANIKRIAAATLTPQYFIVDPPEFYETPFDPTDRLETMGTWPNEPVTMTVEAKNVSLETIAAFFGGGTLRVSPIPTLLPDGRDWEEGDMVSWRTRTLDQHRSARYTNGRWLGVGYDLPRGHSRIFIDRITDGTYQRDGVAVFPHEWLAETA